MTSTPRPPRRPLTEPARQVPVRDEVDVLVCGGGSAGMVAALAAARLGMRVALVEQYGFCGGALTAIGVNGIGGFQFDVDGRPLIDGLPLEIMRRLADADGAEADYVRALSGRRENAAHLSLALNCYWVRAHPEQAKVVLDEMMEEAGVRLLYHATVAAPVMDGDRVTGVFVESKSGREAILAKVTIDCTGDGDVAARAGAAFEMGRPDDGACQPMTAIFTVANWGADAHHKAMRTDPLARNRYTTAVALARERGDIQLNPNDLFCAATYLNPHESRTASVNFTRIQHVDATNADDLTRAEVLGRKQVVEAIRFMRKYMAGGREAALVAMPVQIGIRVSRRIIGDYVLTGDDVMAGARFPDAVVRGIYTVDIHNPAEVGAPSVLTELEQPYDIPYRCLVPHDVDGLLVAGRCISGDHVVLSSYRIQSHCMAMGQAVGTAAALAVRHETLPREVDTDELRAALRENGANVGP